MKKLSNILVTLGVTIFLLSFGMKSEAVGQLCTILKDTLTIAGCEYEFQVCVYCGLSYPGYAEVRGFTPLDPNCSNGLTFEQLMNQAQTQLGTSASLWLDFCLPTVPPCDGEERKVLEWRIPLCWVVRLENIIPPVFPETEPTYVYLYLPCESDEYCAVEYEYCRDEFGVLHHNVNNFSASGDPDCELEGFQIEFPTSYIYEESDCYILHTVCNP